MSVSDTVVSSNPGVSISLIGRPSISKTLDSFTVEVQDLKPVPTCILEPLAKLMNYSPVVSLIPLPRNNAIPLTVDFPVPLPPITLEFRVQQRLEFRGIAGLTRL